MKLPVTFIHRNFGFELYLEFGAWYLEFTIEIKEQYGDKNESSNSRYGSWQIWSP